MVISSLALLIAAPATPALRSKADLQARLDRIVAACSADGNLRAKAISPRTVAITFTNPPAELNRDKTLLCVMAKAKTLRGVVFGIIGREQYLDDKGQAQ